MKLRIPDFYDKFKCKAGDCTDTCCNGWEIDIDERTRERYAALASEPGERGLFGKKILQAIDGGHFRLDASDRCPLLRKDGLCELICNLGVNGSDIDESGKSVLCDICREHPRFVEVYGDLMEKGLGLCCEEAVRLLLDCDGSETAPIRFLEREIDDEPDDIPPEVEHARNSILQEREEIFSILADRSVPLNRRLVAILDFAESIDAGFASPEQVAPGAASPENGTVPNVDGIAQAWIDTLAEGEVDYAEWEYAIARIKSAGPSNLTAGPSKIKKGSLTESDGERIVAYMIFRYYAKSLFDGDSIGKVKFAIFFWLVLQRFENELAGDTIDESRKSRTSAKIDAVKLLSKQIEYSDEVMDALNEKFCGDPAFSTESFRRILSGEQ